MGQMTDTVTSSITDFYDALSADYDTMTGFEQRFVKERPFFRVFVERYGITSALDAGCGTGFHSLLLAQLGVKVTAVDVSQSMLNQVKRHAAQLGLSVRTVRTEFQSLSRSIKDPVDGIFCLGNSLAHLLSQEHLTSSLGNFFDVLRPGGTLFIQNLNYDRILKTKDRVQSVKDGGGKTFIRFYEYDEEEIVFTILTIDRPNGAPRQSQRSVRLRPVLRQELTSLLVDSGFTETRSFGGFALEEYDPETSKDLFVIARKPEG